MHFLDLNIHAGDGMSHKIWIALRLLVLCVICCGSAISSEYKFAVVETLETGTINWSRRTIQAEGSGVPVEKSDPTDLDKQERLVEEATSRVHGNLIQTISMIPLDTEQLASDLIARQSDVKNQIRSMVDHARIVTKDYLTDGSVQMRVELSFDGGFAQLMLPEDIQQIQPLKTLVTRPLDKSDTAFTGLVVDTRGLAVRPVLAPKVLDERGQEVYGPTYISREYAVSHGTVLYSRSIADPAVALRVGKNPLIVTGLKALGTFHADIVISTADATKLQSDSSYLKMLNHCKVAIILNGKKH